MLRSEIDARIGEAAALFASHGLALPPWARFTPADWAARPDEARHCAERQMGWDVTDFGSGDFGRRGLLLLCMRNGLAGRAGERSYAEKLMVVRDGQETPFHHHRRKAEDIVNRGGGDLVVEVTAFEGDRETAEPVAVRVDGALRLLPPRAPLVLSPGESVTLMPGQVHRFHGRGTVVAGEVSEVNDDHTDNVFLEPPGRFADVIEDAPARFALWSDLERGAAGPMRDAP